MSMRLAPVLALALAMSMIVAPAALAAPQPEGDGQIATPHVYLHWDLGDPWQSDANDEGMDTAFGPDGWDEEHFGTVDVGTDAGGIFAPGVRLIFIDGSDWGAEEAEAFIAANEPALKAFVARGGGLVLNAAPNEGDGLTFDGRTIAYRPSETGTGSAKAVATAHPIFAGPFTPVATSYNGALFGHALVEGPGLTPLILRREASDPESGDPNSIVLAEYSSGAGTVLIGGVVLLGGVNNLGANVLHYAATAAPPPPPADGTAPRVVSSGCMGTTQMGVTVADEGGSGPAAVRYSIDGGAERTLATDAAGAARIALALGVRTVALRGVDRAGNVQATPTTVRLACERTKPAVKLAGIPKRCTSSPFRLRLTLADAGGLSRLVVKRGSKRVKASSFGSKLTKRSKLTVKIAVAKLKPGRHTIEVVVTDQAGNKRTVVRRFRRCSL